MVASASMSFRFACLKTSPHAYIPPEVADVRVIAMFNRNLRTLSANLNGLGLGFNARSFAAVANVIDMAGCTLRIRVTSSGDQSPEPELPHGETDAWPTDHAADSDQRYRPHQRQALSDFRPHRSAEVVDRISPVRMSMLTPVSKSVSWSAIATSAPTATPRPAPDSIDSSSSPLAMTPTLSPWHWARTGPDHATGRRRSLRPRTATTAAATAESSKPSKPTSVRLLPTSYRDAAPRQARRQAT